MVAEPKLIDLLQLLSYSNNYCFVPVMPLTCQQKKIRVKKWRKKLSRKKLYIQIIILEYLQSNFRDLLCSQHRWGIALRAYTWRQLAQKDLCLIFCIGLGK